MIPYPRLVRRRLVTARAVAVGLVVVFCLTALSGCIADEPAPPGPDLSHGDCADASEEELQAWHPSGDEPGQQTVVEIPNEQNFSRDGEALYWQAEWVLPGGGNATIRLNHLAANFSDVRMEMRCPGGQVADSQNVQNPWIIWTLPFDGYFGESMFVYTPYAKAGTWTLRVYPTADVSPVLMIRVLYDGPLRLDVRDVEYVNVSEPATVQVAVLDGDQPVLGASVVLCCVPSSNDTPEERTMLDTGEFPDVRADDGVYSTQVTFDESGGYGLSVDATVGERPLRAMAYVTVL